MNILYIKMINIYLKLVINLDSSAVSYWFIFINEYKKIWKLKKFVIIIFE